MKIFWIVVWGLAAFYTAVCVRVPEARLISWRGSQVKPVGTTGHVGCAMILWLPALIFVGQFVGLLPKTSPFILYLAIFTGFLVVMFGWLIDISTK